MIFKNFIRNLKLKEGLNGFEMDSFNQFLYNMEKDCNCYIEDQEESLTKLIIEYNGFIICESYIFRNSSKSKYKIPDLNRQVTIHFINFVKEEYYKCYNKKLDDVYGGGFLKKYYDYLKIRDKLEEIQNKKSTNI
jgi:hypothetical protein